jgi:hypothetical protein
MRKYDNILPNSSQNEKYFRQSCREKSENTGYVHCAVDEIMCKYMVTQSGHKAIPLQAWTGPEGSRRLRLPDFKTIGT